VSLGREATFPLSGELSPEVGEWSNYPMTVARRLARNFPGPFIGADIALVSDLPQAAGLSSSSALIVGTFLLLARINRLDEQPAYRANIHGPEGIAAYCGTIENGQSFGTLTGDRGVGTFGGSQDHTAILCCKAGTLSQYAFCPVRKERELPLSNDLTFAVANSGVVAEKTGSALAKFNGVARRATRLLELWNGCHQPPAPCLAAALGSPQASSELRGLIDQLSCSDKRELLTNRLAQFERESNLLIPRVGDAVARSDYATLGELVDASQRLAEENLLNQVSETIELQRTARRHGALAASAFGAGFGGSVWALVEQSRASRFLEEWLASARPTMPNIDGLVTRPGPAATFV
jgi:galactokinase